MFLVVAVVVDVVVVFILNVFSILFVFFTFSVRSTLAPPGAARYPKDSLYCLILSSVISAAPRRGNSTPGDIVPQEIYFPDNGSPD